MARDGRLELDLLYSDGLHMCAHKTAAGVGGEQVSQIYVAECFFGADGMASGPSCACFQRLALCCSML